MTQFKFLNNFPKEIYNFTFLEIKTSEENFFTEATTSLLWQRGSLSVRFKNIQ